VAAVTDAAAGRGHDELPDPAWARIGRKDLPALTASAAAATDLIRPPDDVRPWWARWYTAWLWTWAPGLSLVVLLFLALWGLELLKVVPTTWLYDQTIRYALVRAGYDVMWLVVAVFGARRRVRRIALGLSAGALLLWVIGGWPIITYVSEALLPLAART
jgi:hypothetical protein